MTQFVQLARQQDMAVVLNYEDLLRHCVDVLESFDADRASVDTHTAEYLKSHCCLVRSQPK